MAASGGVYVNGSETELTVPPWRQCWYIVLSGAFCYLFHTLLLLFSLFCKGVLMVGVSAGDILSIIDRRDPQHQYGQFAIWRSAMSGHTAKANRTRLL